MKQYDVIIIGSGLGGLTAGAKLAKEGKKVFLIEQHSVPGGCATTFKRKDYTMEVGLHAIDGLDKQDPKKKIFDDLGVFDNVQFIKTDALYRIRNERFDTVIPSSTQNAIESLTEKYPEESIGIKKFYKTICAIRKEIA
ncbi:MAG: FAD-binding protein, partial [Candidatus Electrothrix sp. AUS4]|nr:FAD-binding protein [Candidatus Electrothrix sp. AUS4]